MPSNGAARAAAISLVETIRDRSQNRIYERALAQARIVQNEATKELKRYGIVGSSWQWEPLSNNIDELADRIARVTLIEMSQIHQRNSVLMALWALAGRVADICTESLD